MRETDHIHISFITVYCYNYSILLLIIYKLSFIRICIHRKKGMYRIQCIQASTGGLRRYPSWIRETIRSQILIYVVHTSGLFVSYLFLLLIFLMDFFLNGKVGGVKKMKQE